MYFGLFFFAQHPTVDRARARGGVRRREKGSCVLWGQDYGAGMGSGCAHIRQDSGWEGSLRCVPRKAPCTSCDLLTMMESTGWVMSPGQTTRLTSLLPRRDSTREVSAEISREIEGCSIPCLR